MDRPIETLRYLALARQLERELGTVKAVEKALGVGNTGIIKLRNEKRRKASLDMIGEAMERFRLPMSFFKDEKLGDEPDYRLFQAQESRLEPTGVRADADLIAEVADELDLSPEIVTKLQGEFWTSGIAPSKGTLTNYALDLRKAERLAKVGQEPSGPQPVATKLPAGMRKLGKRKK